MYSLPKIERFNQSVLSKFHVYNSVFLTLPFDTINNTGVLLPLFAEVCETGFRDNLSPIQIVEQFSNKYLGSASETQRIDILFRFIQYVERQVVLFDAVEDAAFPVIHNMEGHGSLRDIKETADARDTKPELRHFLEHFKVRTVLTAHPTQFYPGSVLGIITDLTEAIRQDDLPKVKELLSQLGKTPFIKKEKPTPFDEAVSLTWYLENVFYQSCGEMVQYIQKNIFGGEELQNPILGLGFWPGGDRDGNPFVTTETSLKVASRLQNTLLKCYYRDIRQLKRKLTFPNVDHLVAALESQIYRSAFYSEDEIFITVDAFRDQLLQIKQIVIEQHQSLYLDDVNDLLNKLKLFGLYFASLDLRQNSRIHDSVFAFLVQSDAVPAFPKDYFEKDDAQKVAFLSEVQAALNPDALADELAKSTLGSVKAMQAIQQRNGEAGSNRYVISNCESAVHIMEAFALIRLCGWEQPTVDIVPLFEIIEDLRTAHLVMEQIYTNPAYAVHLKRRGNRQTVMLGFSDGTKDGGYLMANWSIYQAKERITAISRQYGIEVLFFDGRGGPPARGGGKTHKFYASLGPEIENHEIQLTVQGQTISSNFGTPDSCRFNLENLLSAGVSSGLFNRNKNVLTAQQKETLDKLSAIGYQTYADFKAHPKFIPYLEKMSTLPYYAKTNIGSRPSKRGGGDGLNFADLRAIPFVGSWSQLKQNVPGFYGVGAALLHFEESGQWDAVKDLYDHSLFFKTLLENSMMSIAKSFFPLTAYMKDDVEFGGFWQMIHDEFERTKRLLLKISGHDELMENYPDGKASIAIREKIVIPLLVVQQYALQRIKAIEDSDGRDEALLETYRKIVTRSLFGNTNASRNSA